MVMGQYHHALQCPGIGQSETSKISKFKTPILMKMKNHHLKQKELDKYQSSVRNDESRNMK